MSNSEKFKIYLAYRCYLVSSFECFCKSALQDLTTGFYSLEDALHECQDKFSHLCYSFRNFINFCIKDGLFTTTAGLEEYMNFDMSMNHYLKAVRNGCLGGISIYGK